MAMTAEQRKTIMRYMLEHIEKDDKEIIAKTTEVFSISKTTVYKYLRQMLEDGDIKKNDNNACKYALVSSNYGFGYSTSSPLEEDRIFQKDIYPLIKNLPENVVQIFRYIFTEMMNNAIEHACAKNIGVAVLVNKLCTKVMIYDDGIGIFKKIQLFFKEKGEELTLEEAADALIPGKLTTAEKNHSGEGIFFSSRAADNFSIYSDGHFFCHKNFAEDIVFEIGDLLDNGTAVLFSMNNSSTKKLKDVFDMFADPERGFFKTQIPISHMFANGYPVSRSEARRLGSYVSRFEDVNLDFKDVSNIGQAFTHELFIVFQENNPNIKLNIINANDEVQRMISRVKNTK